ncbi:MAG: ABC transporter permease [bacterium]
MLTFKLAWQSLLVHKGRTALTVLGIVIGIAAVIMVMSAGESIKGLVLSEVEAFGTDIIQVEIKVPTTNKNSTSNAIGMAQGIEITTLTLDDAKAIAKLPNVKNYYAGLMGQNVISYLDNNKSAYFYAASPSFIDMDKSEVAQGRFYSIAEDNELARVAVLGYKIAQDLFGDQEPTGQSIKIGRFKFKVIGVLTERGGGMGLNFDDMIFLPLQTAQKLLLGVDHISWATTQVADASRQDQTAEDIIGLLRERHDINDPKDDDFAVTTMAEARDMINTIFGGITLLLIAIAAISLIVGGIGIMNIMYVSVTERTFEIGLRKSVGANPKQILWQFLWEAIMITAVGGIIGIIIGIGLAIATSLAARQFGFNWPFALPPQAILIAFIFCGAVGLAFGYYPARRAAKMSPITALGFE